MRVERSCPAGKTLKLKQVIKSLLARTPYRLVRRTRVNRFQAIDEALKALAGRGLVPSIVVDAGANTGDFARLALVVFPKAVVHVIEPQPGCGPALQKLASAFPRRVVVHMTALGAPEMDGRSLVMDAGETTTSTGAYVKTDGAGLTVPCRSLDSLLGATAPGAGSVLLKLDLQGFELEALKGAISTLGRTDIVLTEVSFYAQAYEPPISALVAFLAHHGSSFTTSPPSMRDHEDDRPRQGDLVFVRADAEIARDKAWSQRFARHLAYGRDHRAKHVNACAVFSSFRLTFPVNARRRAQGPDTLQSICPITAGVPSSSGLTSGTTPKLATLRSHDWFQKA